MNTEEFLRELKDCASMFNWYIGIFGYIRGNPKNPNEFNDVCCPIEAVWYSKNNRRFRIFLLASEDMRIEKDDMEFIVSVADNYIWDEQNRIDFRNRMLEAVGLSK
jgi:hypothetical protein